MNDQKNTRLQAFNIIIVFVIVAVVLLYIFNTYMSRQHLGSMTEPTLNCDDLSGSTLPPIPAIPSFTWQKSGLITLWFDDAWITQFTVAFPLMEKEKFRGAVAIPTQFICNKGAMTWNDLRILQNNGWEITAHTIHHQCDLGYYNTPEKVVHELLGSKQIIMSHGLRADQFVMPCGFSRNDVTTAFVNDHPPIVETAEKYFSSYRTTKDYRINSLPVIDPYNLNAFEMRHDTKDEKVEEAIKIAKNEKGWFIIVFHQIDNSNLPLSITRDKFIKVLEMVKQSGLPVVLPSQALAIKKDSTS